MSDKDWDWMREEVFLTKREIIYAWLLIASLILGFVAATLGFAFLWLGG